MLASNIAEETVRSARAAKSLFKKFLVERDVDSIAAVNSKPRGGRINLAGTITNIATNTTLQTQWRKVGA
jgi:hypothetical protein